MDVTITSDGAFDWGIAASIAGIWVGSVATGLFAWFAYVELRPLRRELSTSRYLTAELSALMAAHVTAPGGEISQPASGQAESYVIREIRAGLHPPVFERVAIEFEGRHTPEFDVMYVDPIALDEANISGQEALRIRLLSDGSSRENMKGVVARLNGEQVVDAISREQDGIIDCLIGVRSKVPFSALTLSDPPRIAIDLKYD